ncbi:MAG TPA: CaiB/BaiF CoA-transferase family protein [Gemmatimonadales bacterium]|nr:CaiB/BaiF CoA-transferase family protein [Gemmatimonadales bacterium]
MPEPGVGALSHIRVLDLSRVLAGPWASQLLADLGADVIKVERPGTGDDTRHWGPPTLRDRAGRDTGEAAYFLATNRGKQSITINYAAPEGQAIIRRLVAQSDVLIENHKVGDLARYGLDYESLRREHPRLVYCSITGFGQTGPEAERAGYDFVIQALGGLMSVTGEPDGPPEKVGVAVADIMAGLYAGIAILAALAHRERSGNGQHIDLALLDVQVATLANVALNYLVSGAVPQRWGNAHPNIVPYQVFGTADRAIVLAIGNDVQFARFCEVAGAPELAGDPRFATSPSRVEHRAVLVPIVAKLLAGRPAATWVAELEQRGVPCAPINDVAQVFSEPQVRHRGMRVELPHPVAGTVPLVGSPIRLSETPVNYRRAPPLLGEHTDMILRERLGMSAGEITRLRSAGVI